MTVRERLLQGAVIPAHPLALTAERKLDEIMSGIHERCAAAAEQYGTPGDYVAGANIAGFVRVAEAMKAQGVV